MKRMIIFLLVVVIWYPSLAQSGLFEQLSEKYADKSGFSASQITSDMFDLYLKKKNIDEGSPVYEALKNLDKILVISQSNLPMGNAAVGKSTGTEDSETDEVWDDMLNYYKKNNYTLFKTENRMGEDVKVYLKKNNDDIAALALITNSSAAANLVELQGDIDLKTIAEISDALNLHGLENLYKIGNSSGYSVGTSFSPSSWYSQQRMEEMMDRQREIAEKQREISDVQREKMKEQEQLMAEKYREMAERYQRQPFFLNVPGDTSTEYYINGKKSTAKEVKTLEPDEIKSIEVNKADKKKEKTTVNIKTK